MSTKEKIIELLLNTGREGIEEIIEYLKTSDFFTAPASTKYHSNFEGGLAEHSFKVYERMLKVCADKELFPEKVSTETVIISALLHDICKTGVYKTEFRNKKVYSETGSKYDEAGKFDWKSVLTYVYNDDHPLGHGEKSVIMLLTMGMKLTKEEIYAIRWHMGPLSTENHNEFSNAANLYKIAAALHIADMEATYFLEETVE